MKRLAMVLLLASCSAGEATGPTPDLSSTPTDTTVAKPFPWVCTIYIDWQKLIFWEVCRPA